MNDIDIEKMILYLCYLLNYKISFKGEKMARPSVVKEQASQIEELKKQIEALMAMQQTKQESEPQEKLSYEDPEQEAIVISQDEYITLISLYPNILTLTEDPKGKGKKFTFAKFGETKRILYSDLTKLLENHSGGDYTDFFKEGYVLIANDRVIRRHGLNESYGKMLTKDKIKQIVDGKGSNLVEIFKMATKAQQIFICDMLIAKFANGEDVDLNLVDSLSRVSGIKIQEKAEEAKRVKEIYSETSKKK